MQYSLPFIDVREVMEMQLSKITGYPVRLKLNRNRSTYFSCQRRRNVLEIKLHKIFSKANSDVINAIGRLAIRRTSKAVRTVSLFYESATFSDDDIAHKKIKCNPVGKYYDLKVIFDKLNEVYFNNSIKAMITWGKAGKKRKLRNIHLGTYDYQTGKITIHPNLDRDCIPQYVVEATVYHEMCHQAAGSFITARGHKRHHTEAFRKLERKFSRYDDAKKWEKKNLNLLLRA